MVNRHVKDLIKAKHTLRSNTLNFSKANEKAYPVINRLR